MSVLKLNQANLRLLGDGIAAPQYERRDLGQGIAHIGVGGFHRAHEAIYTEDLFLQQRDMGWGICGVGLLPQDGRMAEVMHEQDCLYTLVERRTDGDRARVVGSIVNYLFAPDNPQAVIEKLAAPETKIVSMTVTEGGYYGRDGQFDSHHPDVVHDLAYPGEPRCSFGYLLEALNRRRHRGLPPFTVLSCDNIQENGAVSRRTLLAMAELREPILANWLRNCGAFPNSMVDRITPATTDEDRTLVENKFGLKDGWPVVTESYRQWVIEDQFVQGRPSWDEVGVQMTTDVLPYERIKLRLLNAAHQALCYIGMLLGYEFVHEAMNNPRIVRLVRLLMDEVTPLLAPVRSLDLSDYKRTVVDRFSNAAVRDQLSRIGIYGSSGMPKFVLPSIEEQITRGGSVRMLSFVVASWLRYLNGTTDNGIAMPMKDPMGPRLRVLTQASGKDPRPLIANREIFTQALASSPLFVDGLVEFLDNFYVLGTAETLRRAVS